MANETCLNILHVDHVRVLRLGSNGAVLEEPDARYEYDAAILLSYTAVQPDRATAEQRRGNGDVCATFRGPAQPPSGVDLQLNLCTLDAELIELLVGGQIIDTATGGGDTIGWLAPTDATVNVDGVAIEAWSKAWNNNARALYNGQAAWFRHVFPKTTWQLAEQSLNGDGFTVIQLTGSGEPNAGFDTGWSGDPFPVSVGDSPWGYVLDDAKPAGACGYQSTES